MPYPCGQAKMITHEQDIDFLLKARAEIDDQLRKHKNTVTVLFTDVAGSTSFFERNGDTAGLAMLHRHDELSSGVVQQYGGKVIKTIGDSTMAEFPDATSAVRAGVEIERQFLSLNSTLPERQRVGVRIGIHSGVGFRKGNDLFGDVVNVAARIVKRTAPAQILISRAVYEAVSKEPDLQCQWLSKYTMDGRTEKEDIYEVAWTDAEAYRELRERLAGPSSIPSRYEVLSQVGNGGMGVVYKVRDLETDEIVALKILKPEIARDPAVQENFKRELCLARKITHKNVCRIHDFSRSNGTAYASMEFVEGESLLSRLNRVGTLPVNQAFDIAQQICAGLREAHAQGIVHRDLKPANIMLDRSGAVKIMDFGVARLIQNTGPMTGTIVGTPAYMAPEQAELKAIGPWTDIYALGLLLYEMITGVQAFQGDTPVAIALKQIREYPKRPRRIIPNLSHPIEAAILKCLQKDPAKRFQSAGELQIALVKAARARAVPPWRVAIDRELGKAEMLLRQGARYCLESASAFIKRHDGRILPRIRTEPATAFVVSVLLGSAISVAVYGSGKTNANGVPAAYRSSVSESSASSAVPARPSVAAFNQPLSPNPGGVIISRDVDLRRDSRDEFGDTPSASVKAPRNERASLTATSAVFASPVSQPVKSGQPSTHSAEQNARANIQVPTEPQALSKSTQLQTLLKEDTSQPAASEAAKFPPQPNSAPTSTGGEVATPSTVSNPADPAARPTTHFFIEVASFKDQTWADNAVEKLTQLGFHAIVVHKTLLWAQTYHVEVGPYSDPKAIEAVRKNLASNGYKSRLVN
jgi:serine/threonine protein kinase/class 3 adenylate cyclase